MADDDLWYRCIHPDDLERVRAEERRSAREAYDFECEFRMVDADGRVHGVWERDTRVVDEDGSVRRSPGHRRRRHRPAPGRVRRCAPSATAPQRYLDIAGAIDRGARRRAARSAAQPRRPRAARPRGGRALGRRLVRARSCAGAPRARARPTTPSCWPARPTRRRLREPGPAPRDGERAHRRLAQHAAARRATARSTGSMSAGLDVTERRAAEEQIAYLAYHDPLTGPARTARCWPSTSTLALARARRAGPRGRAALPRPRRLQARQRLARPRRRRRAAAPRRAAPAGAPPRHRPARPPGRRRVPAAARRPRPRDRRRGRARRAPRACCSALHEPFVVSGAEFHIGAIDRDLASSRATPHDADALLRHADAAMYAGQGRRARRGRPSTTGDPHEPLRAPVDDQPPAPGARRGRARAALAADRRPARPARCASSRRSCAGRTRSAGSCCPASSSPFAEETGLHRAPRRAGSSSSPAASAAAWQRDGLRAARSPSTSRRASCAARASSSRSAATIAAHGLDPSCVTRRDHRVGGDARTPSAPSPRCAELAETGRARWRSTTSAPATRRCARLRELPVEWLKIDRSFLAGVPDDPAAAAIAHRVVELAQALGMQAVAEGVETEAQRELPRRPRVPAGAGLPARAADAGRRGSRRARAHAGRLTPAPRRGRAAPRARIIRAVEIAFDASGLVPVHRAGLGSGEVLTLAYANAEAVARTRETGELHLWSRSRGELWHKGATSGNVAARARAAPGLRRRRAAGARRARRPGLPHGRAHLLLHRRPRAARAARGAARPRAHARRARRRAARGLLHRRAARRPGPHRREGAGGGRGGRPRRARGVRRRAWTRRRPTCSTTCSCCCTPAAARWPTRGRSSLAVAAERSPRSASRRACDEVRALARDYNLVPLRHTFIDDCETPVSAFLKLRGRRPEYPAFLLESAEQGRRVGRWSFIGLRPQGDRPLVAGRRRRPVRAGRARGRRATARPRSTTCRRSRAARWASSATTSSARSRPRSAIRTRTCSGCPTWRSCSPTCWWPSTTSSTRSRSS